MEIGRGATRAAEHQRTYRAAKEKTTQGSKHNSEQALSLGSLTSVTCWTMVSHTVVVAAVSLTLLGTGCTPSANPYLDPVCPWLDALEADSGELLAARETTPALAISLDRDEGAKWMLAEAPKCSGLVRVGRGLVCWQGATDNRTMTSTFQVFVAEPPYHSWKVVRTNETRRQRLLFDTYLLFAGTELAPGAVGSSGRVGLLDVSKIPLDGALPTGAMESFATVAEAEAVVTSRLFRNLPPSCIALARSGPDCWALREQSVLHASCEKAAWKAVAKLDAAFTAYDGTRDYAAAGPGALYVARQLWNREGSAAQSQLAVVRSNGRMDLEDGPPAYVQRFRVDAHGTLWVTAPQGIFARASEQRDWVVKLRSLPCGPDYKPLVRIY